MSEPKYEKIVIAACRQAKLDGMDSLTLDELITFMQATIHGSKKWKRHFPYSTLGKDLLHVYLFDHALLTVSLNKTVASGRLLFENDNIQLAPFTNYVCVKLRLKAKQVTTVGESAIARAFESYETSMQKYS